MDHVICLSLGTFAKVPGYDLGTLPLRNDQAKDVSESRHSAPWAGRAQVQIDQMQGRGYRRTVAESSAQVGSRTSRGRVVPNAPGSVLERTNVVGATWVLFDTLTVLVAVTIALRSRLDVFAATGTLQESQILQILLSHFGVYMAWFALCLTFFTRSYGLYGPIQARSGLNEQRMTLQATLIAGLILCGTLYLTRASDVSRVAVVLAVLLTGAMLCARRALWRSLVYNRYREGLDTRNVLIVGSGRVGHALRNHLESLGASRLPLSRLHFTWPRQR